MAFGLNNIQIGWLVAYIVYTIVQAFFVSRMDSVFLKGRPVAYVINFLILIVIAPLVSLLLLLESEQGFE